MQEKILIVEDELLIAEDIKSQLQQMGYKNVFTAATGEEAVKRAEEISPDAVIMDIDLGRGIDGIEAAERICARRNIPIIYLTDSIDKTLLERAEKTNSYGLLLKPYNTRELIINLGIALHKAKVDQEKNRLTEFYSTILESVRSGVFVTDRNDQIMFLNMAMAAIVGSSKEACLGLNMSSLFAKQTTQEFISRFMEAKTSLNPVCFDAITVMTPSGRKTCQSGWCIPMTDQDGFSGMICTLDDITERQQAEAELKASEKKFSSILNSIHEAVWSYSLTDNDYLYMSPSVEKIFGKTVAEFKQQGQFLINAVHPDDMEAHIEKYDELEEKGFFEFEHRIIRKDGSIGWVRNRTTFIYDENGQPDRIDGLFTDITALKTNEALLKKSEAKVSSILDSIDDVVGSFSIKDEEHIYMSPSLEKMFGRSIDAFKAERNLWIECIHPEDIGVFEAINNQLAEKGYSDTEFRICHPDGSIRWVRNRSKIVYDENGEPDRIDKIVTDITGRKQSEEALVFQHDFQKLVAEISSRFAKYGGELLDDNIDSALYQIGEFFGVDRSYVVMFSDDYQTMDFTHEWCRDGIASRRDGYRGYPVSSLPWLFKEIQELKPVHIPDIDAMPPEASADQQVLSAFNIKSLIGLPLVVQKRLIGFMGLHSVVEHKNWEESQRALLWVVAEIMAGALLRKQAGEELLKAKQVAEEANLSKSMFLSNMSHEIRTPMAGILGMIEMLQHREQNTEKLKIISDMSESANSLLNIINDILDLSKIEAGKIELSNEDFRLDWMIQRIISLYSVLSGNKGLRLGYEMAGDVPNSLFGDPLRLEQVLRNLVSNAIKFTPEGEVLIRVSTDPLSGSSCHLVFEVKDTGIGIPQDAQSHLFESFRQADSSYSKQYGGTGLGLCISKNLAELMGGQMWVKSVQGEGSSFYFTVPFQPGALKEDGAAVPADTLPVVLPRLKILVAEDVDINQQYISFILNKAGHLFTMVSNGAEALETYRRDRFDLILMDIQMPEMGGVEATRRIRELEQKAHLTATPIIALTAYAIKEEREKIMQAGMDGYVTKPINSRLLFSEMSRVIAGRVGVLTTETADKESEPVDEIGSPINMAKVAEQYEEDFHIWKNLLLKFTKGGIGKYREELGGAVETEDFKLIHILSHRIEGILGAICAEASMRTAVALEAAAANGDAAGCRQKWTQLEESFEPLVQTATLYDRIRSFDIRKGLEMISWDMGLYLDILKKFKRGNRNFCERVRQEGDFEQRAQQFHTIKGVAANIGAVEIQRLATLLEDRIKGGEDIVNTAEFEAFEKALHTAFEEIGGLAEMAVQDRHPLLSEELLRDRLVELKTLLDEYDTSAVDKIREIKATLLEMSCQDEANALEAQIEQYNFEEALNLCLTIEEKIFI